jgi:sugar/nucleoside kinase (ribokinase family)
MRDPAGKRYDLCCIGHITLDKVITSKATVHLPGGTAFYFSHAIAGMEMRYLLVTALAASELAVVTALEKRGIEVKAMPSRQTVLFENRYSEDQDHRTQRVLQEADPFTAGQLQDIEAAIFHLGPLLANDMPMDLIKALAGKGKVSLDVQGFLRKVEKEQVVPIDWKAKKEVLPLIHYVKVNEEELKVLTGATDIHEGARTLAQWGVQEVIVTLGSKGSVIDCGGNSYSIPAYAPSSVVDATGCGDTFMAGYLAQRAKGSSIQQAGEFAAAMATLKIAASGPFTGNKADVEKLTGENKLTG